MRRLAAAPAPPYVPSGGSHISSAGATVIPTGGETPYDVNNRCEETICLTVHSQGGSGPIITYWSNTAYQPPSTTICDPVLEFTQNGYVYAYESFSGCYTTGPNQEVAIYGNADVGNGTDMAGDELCDLAAPNPPLAGEVCIEVGT